MSEFQPKSPEQAESAAFDSKEFEKRNQEVAAEKERNAAEALENNDPDKKLEAIRESIEKIENQKPTHETAHSEKAASESAVALGGAAHKHTIDRTKQKIRKQLKPTERSFSKVIHQPVVEALSDVGGATVARPSGLLFGGLFSVLSSLIVLYISKHYGYEYNFLIGLASFAGGFALGILVEGLFRVFKRA